MATVRIICGANAQELEYSEGLTPRQLHDRLRDVMNIPDKAQYFVTGSQIDPDTPLEPGQQLEFVRPAGVKG